jgi:hypothetical protein
MSDDFRSAWEEAVAMYRAQKSENDRLRTELEAEISKLIAENRRLRAEVSRKAARRRLIIRALNRALW